MIGQTVEARSVFSPWIVINLVAVAALVGWSLLAVNLHPLIAAALPLGISIGLLLGRPSRIAFLIETAGIRPLTRYDMINFDTIHAITVNGNSFGSGALSLVNVPMEIHHDRGTLTVPPIANVDVAELHNFLQSQLPPRPARRVPTVLGDFYAQQITKFGPDKVTVIHTREHHSEPWRRKRRKWIAAGICLAGLAWIVSGVTMLSTHKNSDEYGAWIVFGFLLGLGGILGYLTANSRNGNQARHWLAKFPSSCLVVAPPGIALIQGDTKGALPWSEITGVTTNISQWARTSRVKGVQLRVRGAEILILDIYERSPSEIEELFRRNIDTPLA